MCAGTSLLDCVLETGHRAVEFFGQHALSPSLVAHVRVIGVVHPLDAVGDALTLLVAHLALLVFRNNV